MADDIGVDAVKIGMLGTAETVRAVREALELRRPARPIVIDPVMVAESGAVLLDDAGARRRSSTSCCRCAAVITPNLPEARVLAAGAGERRRRRGARAARCTRSARPRSSSPAATATRRPTCSSTATSCTPIPGERHPDGAAHGSGCTHSSALAAHLALGFTPAGGRPRGAREIAGDAVRDGLRGIGAGAGPVDVFDLTSAARSARPGAPGRSPAARRVT